MENNCGIYYIQNTKNKKIYIGQSINLSRRKQQHLGLLKSNSHFNKYLQNSFNKYGEDYFIFKVLEYCNPSELDELEKKYMSFFNVHDNGFNICDGGTHKFPNNSNENHGMWRKDIPNSLLKELYLKDYNSTQLSKLFNCNRRTINRRLQKIFGEDYNKIVKGKHKKGVKSATHKNQNISDDEIFFYYNQGLNSIEISKLINCSDRTVRTRLKGLISKKKYDEYVKSNQHKRTLNNLKKAHTKEAIKKRVNSIKKYSIWDCTKVHYSKKDEKYDNNILKRFNLRYNAKDVHIGGFIDFVTPLIIHDLITENGE